MNDTTLTQESLEKWGFNKETNPVAPAVFIGCRIGAGPFMQYILRNIGESGQIDSDVAATKEYVLVLALLGRKILELEPANLSGSATGRSMQPIWEAVLMVLLSNTHLTEHSIWRN